MKIGLEFILFHYFLWMGVSSLWYSCLSSSDVELWSYQGAGMKVIRLQCSWLAACQVGLNGGRELHSSGIWSLQHGVQGIKNAGWVPLPEKEYNFGLRAGGRAAHIFFCPNCADWSFHQAQLGVLSGVLLQCQRITLFSI